MEPFFEVPMSYPSPASSRRLLDCLETQRFLYRIVRGIRDVEYKEINVLVLNPVIFNIEVEAQSGRDGINSTLSIFDLKDEFEDMGKRFPISHELALQHVRGLLWRYLSYDKSLPWEFVKEEKEGFLPFLSKTKIVKGDFHKAKRKWEAFLGEEVRV